MEKCIKAFLRELWLLEEPFFFVRRRLHVGVYGC